MGGVAALEICAELTQILSHLVLDDNDICAKAECTVSKRLAMTPKVCILALLQFAIQADTEVARLSLKLCLATGVERYDNQSSDKFSHVRDLQMRSFPSFSSALYSFDQYQLLRLRILQHQRTIICSLRGQGLETTWLLLSSAKTALFFP